MQVSNIQKNFESSLEYQGRFLEIEGQHVWGTSGFIDDDGKVHVYFSTWPTTDARAAWVISCKVMYAVADNIDSEFKVVGTALEGTNDDSWDAWSIHNPCVHKVGNKYVMLYMGNNGHDIPYSKKEINDHILTLEKQGLFKVPDENVTKVEDTAPEYAANIWDCYMKLVESKRVGMAIADRPDGVFKRVGSNPIIDVGTKGEWDDLITSNPAFCVTPEGKYHIYYKAWDRRTWHSVHGNRKYGVAISDTLEGEYVKSAANPIVDFEPLGNNAQLEDATVFYLNNQYHMIARDMGVGDNARGIIMSSTDGINFSEPVLAYHETAHYTDEATYGIRREGRYERPQILKDSSGNAIALIGAAMGGQYKSSSPALFKINLNKLMHNLN